MALSFRFGYSGFPFAGIEEIAGTAAAAEQAGFDSFLLADLPGAASPLATLAAVARATTTIKLGTFVANTGLWEPAVAAREWATLDGVSGGRAEVILGAGIPMPASAALMPPDAAARVQRLTATVAALKAAFTEPGLGPAFTARPRLLVAGATTATMRLAAAEADGFIIASVPPAPKVALPPGELALPGLGATRALIERLRGYAGPRAAALEIGTSMQVHLTGDAAGLAAQLAATHSYLTPEQVRASPKALIGTAGQVASAIVERGSQLGLTYPVLRGAPPQQLAEVIAAVRQAQ